MTWLIYIRVSLSMWLLNLNEFHVVSYTDFKFGKSSGFRMLICISRLKPLIKKPSSGLIGASPALRGRLLIWKIWKFWSLTAIGQNCIIFLLKDKLRATDWWTWQLRYWRNYIVRGHEGNSWSTHENIFTHTDQTNPVHDWKPWHDGTPYTCQHQMCTDLELDN